MRLPLRGLAGDSEFITDGGEELNVLVCLVELFIELLHLLLQLLDGLEPGIVVHNGAVSDEGCLGCIGQGG